MEQFNINEKIKQHLLQFQDAYQKINDIHFVCSVTDLKGEIIYVNENFCRISKYSEAELMGQNHRIVNSGYHPPSFFNELWATISSGKFWRGDVKSKAKDGSFFWLDSTIVPIFNDDKEIIHYFSLRLPIDDRKKIEEDRKAYVESLEKMISMTSHSVRHPVTQILAIIATLESENLEPAEQTELLSYLKQSAISLDLFTKELTSFMSNLRKENKIE